MSSYIAGIMPPPGVPTWTGLLMAARTAQGLPKSWSESQENLERCPEYGEYTGFPPQGLSRDELVQFAHLPDFHKAAGSHGFVLGPPSRRTTLLVDEPSARNQLATGYLRPGLLMNKAAQQAFLRRIGCIAQESPNTQWIWGFLRAGKIGDRAHTGQSRTMWRSSTHNIRKKETST